MKQTTSWGGVADWYDDVVNDSDSYQKNVLLPNMLRIVDPKKGLTVLDVACGQGYFSRFFAGAGAKVIATDISIELIEKAQAGQIKESPVEYYVAPADDLSIIEPSSIDVATIVLALQNIENLQGTLSEIARVLKPGGRLVFVLNHPAFRIPQRSDWGWDDKNATQYRRIDSYISDDRVKIDMTPGEKDDKKKKFTVSFHRPLQVYFKAMNKAGLAVTRLEEWVSHKKSQEGPRAAEEDRMRKEIPLFVCVECRK